MWRYLLLLFFFESLAAALLLTPLARRLGPRLGMADRPGPRKIHTRVTPRSGGLAVYAAFMGCLGVNLLAAWFAGRHAEFLPAPLRALCGNLPMRLGPLTAIAAGATLLFALGAWDDIRPLGPRFKLLVQFAAVVPLLIGGVSVKLFLPYPWMGWLVTAFWVVLVTNAFNLIDNMDGLCGGVGAIVCGVMALISLLSSEFYMAAMFLLLAGALAGFLRYNFHPATLFLGDSGSLVTGYLIASLSVVATYYEPGAPTALPVLTPLVALGVPLFDTISVMWIRWRSGRPLMQGDTNHFSHRLTRLGMSVPRAVLFIYVTTLAMGLAALPLRYLPPPAAIAQTVFIALLFILIYLLERAAGGANNTASS